MGKQHNILLVEDNRETQLIIKAIFRNTHNVQAVDNSEDALLLLSEESFDLVLLDINLKGDFGGKELLLKLREQDQTNKLPVIVVTAYDLKPEDEKFISENSSGILPKPIDKNILTEKVEEILNCI